LNIDHLVKTIKENYYRLRNEQEALNFVQYHIKLLEWKKKKLKLGAIVFEVKETYFNGILLYEDVDIRYTKQDNTETDNLKIENRLKALGWKWDLKNIVAAAVVIFLIFLSLYAFCRKWYCDNLPALAYRPEHYNFVIRHGIENSFSASPAATGQHYRALNYWLVDVVTDFCVYFNILL